MGYLDNSSVTVDAILTNKGRQLLAAGGVLGISKFALSDDEIDYDLWNPAHTLGTNYYGAVIENMPILEALPDETQMLRSKLVTLPRNTQYIPQLSVQPTTLLFTSAAAANVTPTTLSGQSVQTYTAISSDNTVVTLTSDIASTSVTAGAFANDAGGGSMGISETRQGTIFTVTPVPASGTQGALTSVITRYATLTIIGNETGGFITIPITVQLPIGGLGSSTP
jgi:hypothetical protein